MQEIKFVNKRSPLLHWFCTFFGDATVGGYLQLDYYKRLGFDKGRFFLNEETQQVEQWIGSKLITHDFEWKNKKKQTIVINCSTLKFEYISI